MDSDKNISKVFPFAYHEKEIRPLEESAVSIASNSLQYGIGAYGGLRGYFQKNKITLFRVKNHYDRLIEASKILGLNYHITFEDFQQIIHDLIKKNSPTGDIYIRPFIHCDQMIIGPRKGPQVFDLSVYMVPLGMVVPTALRLKVSSYFKFHDNSISTKSKALGGYVNSFLASQEAIMAGYDEALVMDQNGCFVEANVANILLSYKGKIMVPFVGSAALGGITISSCIEILQLNGYEVQEALIDRSMIFSCDELILTGTALKISYAKEVDGRMIGNYGDEGGPIFQKLVSENEKILNGDHELSSQYLSYVNV